jgi:hypothetical protein
VAGIVRFADTVLPQLERASLAGQDVVLLGERPCPGSSSPASVTR